MLVETRLTKVRSGSITSANKPALDLNATTGEVHQMSLHVELWRSIHISSIGLSNPSEFMIDHRLDLV